MLKSRCFLHAARRSNGNFVRAAGLFERTAEQDFAKRPVLVRDDKQLLTYDQLNNRIGQYAALLSSKLRDSRREAPRRASRFRQKRRCSN